MDPQLLMALLGPEGAASLMGTTAMTPPMVPTGLPSPAPAPPPMPMMLPPGPVAANEPYRSEPLMGQQPIAQPASLGAALEPMVPMPQSRPAGAPGGTYAAQNAQTTQSGSKLLDTLKSTKMPEAPTAQKVSTPNLPQLKPIQGGGFFDLLASLGIGPQQAAQGMKLPSTLGQALGGR